MTDAQVIEYADQEQRVVVTKTMPQNNKTNITEEERQMIGCWIQQGAKVE